MAGMLAGRALFRGGDSRSARNAETRAGTESRQRDNYETRSSYSTYRLGVRISAPRVRRANGRSGITVLDRAAQERKSQGCWSILKKQTDRLPDRRREG